MADLVDGTVTSIPLAPLLVLTVCALLVRSRQWWGTAATVVLTLLVSGMLALLSRWRIGARS